MSDDYAGPLGLLEYCLVECELTCVRDGDRVIAGKAGHVITYGADHHYHVEGGPSFYSPEDCAEAIASIEDDDE